MNINDLSEKKSSKNKIGDIINYEKIVKTCRSFDPNETIAVLKYDWTIPASWGMDKLIVDNKKNCRMLNFKVSGHHHKGLIFIFLNGSDLYDVYIVNKDMTIKDIITDLYFDKLTEAIDNKIEKISEYQY